MHFGTSINALRCVRDKHLTNVLTQLSLVNVFRIIRASRRIFSSWFDFRTSSSSCRELIIVRLYKRFTFVLQRDSSNAARISVFFIFLQSFSAVMFHAAWVTLLLRLHYYWKIAYSELDRAGSGLEGGLSGGLMQNVANELLELKSSCCLMLLGPVSSSTTSIHSWPNWGSLVKKWVKYVLRVRTSVSLVEFWAQCISMSMSLGKMGDHMDGHYQFASTVCARYAGPSLLKNVKEGIGWEVSLRQFYKLIFAKNIHTKIQQSLRIENHTNIEHASRSGRILPHHSWR